MDLTAFRGACLALGLDLTPEQEEAFAEFESALYEANQVMNLTRVSADECWLRHFVDSLLLSPHIPEGASVLDIGCGPGFPSWPLACARPDLHVTALDSSGKMLSFLKSRLLPNLTVVQARAEDWGAREYFDVVTGRALAPLPVQMEISAPAVKVGGIVLPMRTVSERELIQAFPAPLLGCQLEAVHEAQLPGTDVVRVFPIYRKVKKSPAKYPRSWAQIKQNPINS